MTVPWMTGGKLLEPSANNTAMGRNHSELLFVLCTLHMNVCVLTNRTEQSVTPEGLSLRRGGITE